MSIKNGKKGRWRRSLNLEEEEKEKGKKKDFCTSLKRTKKKGKKGKERK